MIAVGLSSATIVCLSLFYWGYRRHQTNYPITGKIARFILFMSIVKELSGGIIHFLFPYDCNIHISGVPDGLGIADDMNAMTGMALYTAAEGSGRMILSLVSLIPFVVADPDLFLTTYVMSSHLLVRLMNAVNLTSGVFNDVHSHMPSYI